MESLLRITSENNSSGPRGLILSPTRELAIQTYRFLRKLSKHTSLFSLTLIGGENLNDQFSDLSSKNCDIIVATPGFYKYIL